MTRRQITPDDDYGTEWPFVSELHREPRPATASGAVSLFLGVLLVGLFVIPWVTERVAEWVR